MLGYWKYGLLMFLKESLLEAFVEITSMQNSREIGGGDIHAGPFCFCG